MAHGINLQFTEVITRLAQFEATIYNYFVFLQNQLGNKGKDITLFIRMSIKKQGLLMNIQSHI